MSNKNVSGEDDKKPSAEKPRKPRGFAAMNKDRVREIASLGGKAAHQAGTAHEFTKEEARQAGKLGAKAVHEKRKASSDDDPV